MPAPPRRILELDALRGLAAVAVVLFHYTTRYSELFGHASSPGFAVADGHYGVDLFFMLSGFVILMTLERTPGSWQFAWGRFSRLYPSYWAAAAVTFAAVAFFGLPGQQVTPADAVLNLTMIQSLLGAPHIDGAYWSLQAELIFYVNMLVLYRFGAFRRVGLTVIAWVAAAVAMNLIQPFAAEHWPLVGSLMAKTDTIASLQFIPLFGIGLVYYHAHRNARFASFDRIAIAVCLLAISWIEHGKSAMVASGLAAILWFAISGRAAWLARTPLLWLGAISYTLYLIHQNIGYIVIRELESIGVPARVAILIAIALSLLLADLLHRYVERPSMEQLRRARKSARGQKALAT